jgi:hypothetical protein
MGYDAIDEQLSAWARRHALKLFTTGSSGEARFAYLSSVAGECFQIWIEPPAEGRVGVHVACVEGRRDNDAPLDNIVPVDELVSALELALETAVGWMAPSQRDFPASQDL